MTDDPTRLARIKAVQNALDFANQHSDGRNETILWAGKQLTLPVVELRLEMVVLNPRSRRVVSYLEAHPQRSVVEDDPFGPTAQDLLAALLKTNPLKPSEPDPAYVRLSKDLASRTQLDAGVITYDGVLFNANTRAVALRELGVKTILVAVLPQTASPSELADLELTLQLRPNYLREYSYTSYLLAVHELLGRSSVVEAAALLGRTLAEVEMGARILTLIREIQAQGTVPDSADGMCTLPLTWFNDKQQSLEEIDRTLQKKGKGQLSGHARGAVRDTRLIGMLVGATKLELREIGEGHLDNHLLPLLPPHLRAQVTTSSKAAGALSLPGVSVSLVSAAETGATSDPSALLATVARARTLREVRSPLDPERIAAEAVIRELHKPVEQSSDMARAARRHDERLDGPVRKAQEAASRLAAVSEAVSQLFFDKNFDCEALREAVQQAHHDAAQILVALDEADGVGGAAA